MMNRDPIKRKEYHQGRYQRKKAGIETRLTKKPTKKESRTALLKRNHIRNNKRKETRRILKLKYLGKICFFCKTDEFVLDGHKKDGKRHKDFFAMSDKEFMSAMQSNEYVNICKKCHKSIHWCTNYLGLSWKDIMKLNSAR